MDPFDYLGKAPVEPASDIRQAASGLFQMFTAFIAEGFTPDQALTLVARFLAAQAGGQG